MDVGRAIASHSDAQISTGATSGFPLYVAKGYKENGTGFSIGLSPAASKKEHLEAYKMPLDYNDVVIYTGFGFPGRDMMLVRSSDAIILGCGRIGTIHEFTVAWESDMPIGILEGEWSTDEVIKNIIDNSNRQNDLVIFESDPIKLVDRVMELVKKQKSRVTFKAPGDDSKTQNEVRG
jgi:uncharacterized protein (TIGR00725 family)